MYTAENGQQKYVNERSNEVYKDNMTKMTDVFWAKQPEKW